MPLLPSVVVTGVAGLLALAAPAAAGGLDCPRGMRAQTVAELVLGLNIGAERGVSDADFARFLDREVTTRFPDGFTVLGAAGQWKDAARAEIVREPAKLLMIALPSGAASLKRVTAVAEAYKRDFRQQSVLTILRRACVGF